jgi:hypothetical protein
MAEIHKKFFEHMVSKDCKKKDKAKKWHESVKKFVLFASSTDGIIPASKINEAYVRLINITSSGYADRELDMQMIALGNNELALDTSLTRSLQFGLFRYNQEGHPSNLSISGSAYSILAITRAAIKRVTLAPP